MSQKKLHICLNLIADPNWHAGNIYIFNIIHALSKLPAKERNEIKLSIATRNLKDIPDEIKHKVDYIYKETFYHLAFYKILKMLPAFCRISIFNFRKIDFYYPGGNLPHNWIFKWGGWIPDFQYRYLPQLFSKEEYESRESRNAYLAAQSPVLAFSSKNAMDDYLKFFPQHKGNEFLLRFVSNANEDWLNDNPAETQTKYKLPDAFFMVCNQFWKHKDHPTIIEAIYKLKQKGIIIHVVCTGATEDFRNPDYYPGLLKKAKELGVSEQFIVLGFISRKDQIQLIRRSLAIIQPSLFEGWSTVVEDGRSLGKPIFLSNFPVHVEQNPPYTWYFKQQDADELAALIEKHLNELKPGPDTQKEKTAFEENIVLMAEFGRRIIEMARLI
jgi:glycosyltransferase involved in cell wall biosynthesis